MRSSVSNRLAERSSVGLWAMSSLGSSKWKSVRSINFKHSTKSANRIYCRVWHARMAELVDAPDSKSGGGDTVWVRFPLRAPEFFYGCPLNFCSNCGSPVESKIPLG